MCTLKLSNMADTYSQMQVSHYENAGSKSKFGPGIMEDDNVVGMFHEHNAWPDYQEYLFRHSSLQANTTELLALDFACGPGRNILLFKDRFKRIDGVDIAQKNIDNARIYTSILPEEKKPLLYKCNGQDLRDIPSNTYDIVFSTIALQHICCHSIRYGYIKEFNRILKLGGFLCVQMGFGKDYPSYHRAVPYFANVYNSPGTNSYQDTRIENPEDVEKDLTETGFRNFEYNIRPSGPGDGWTPNWIYWSAIKV